jgi:AraC-like DNA-binding protein
VRILTAADMLASGISRLSKGSDMPIFSSPLEGLRAETAATAVEPHAPDDLAPPSLDPCAACSPWPAPALRTRDHTALERIQRFIEQNLGSPELSPRLICRQIGVSRSQLYRLFAGSPGVADYIRMRRLLKARAALISSSDCVGSVAHACGFSSHAHFSRVFKRHFGCTPWQCAVAGRDER